MPINENMVQEIVQEVMAKMQIADAPTGKHGIFKEMNDAIEAAKKSQLIVKKMSMDQREKIITCIRKKIKENAEVMARMGVEETGMGNVGDKILKHHLVADKTPGTEDLSTTAWSGDRGLTLIEMGLHVPTQVKQFYVIQWECLQEEIQLYSILILQRSKLPFMQSIF